jgi:hypothetical protein
MYEEFAYRDKPGFYPDVAEAGGLGPAFQAQLDAIGSSVRVNEGPDLFRRFPFGTTTFGDNRRYCQLDISIHERRFSVALWDKGVPLGHASTPLLAKIAEVINAWIAKGVNTGELQRRFDCVGVTPMAKAHEEGAEAEVEQKWQGLLERVKNDEDYQILAPLVEKAMEVQILRRLFPFTSHLWLCFSRCTGVSFSGDCPSACPTSRWDRGPLQVPNASPKPYRVVDSKGKFLGEVDAEEAIDLIVQHLPPNCGPAVQGTAEDLA